MSLKDAYLRQKRNARPTTGLSTLFPQQDGFAPTEPGDPNFGLSTTPSSQAQFPAAAAEQRVYQNRTQASNILEQARASGIDTLQPQYSTINQVAETGFKERALKIGEGLINFIDGGREAVNLLFQDVIGGEAEEGYRDPTLGDYMDALWFGIKDQDGFQEATGLNPDSGSHTLDMLGWEPSENLPGKIARGVASFGFEMLTDPLTYVTFGLSGLGKNAAMAASRKFGDDMVAGIMPYLREGTLEGAIGQMSSPYMRRIARNIDGITDDFIEKHLATLDPDRQQAIWRWLTKNGYEDLNPDDTWAIIAAARENASELAIWNKVRDDVMAPLLRRDFKKIDADALADLPAYAYGGARISVPFTERALRKGIVIPGTQGIGKKTIGDPLRKVSAELKDKFKPYRALAKRLDDMADNLKTDRALLRGIARKDGGIEGWQYHIVESSIDRLHNRHVLEMTKAQLNARKESIMDLARKAKPAHIDSEEEWFGQVWGDVMARLEDRGATNTLVQNLMAPDAGRRLELSSDLDKEVEALANDLRGIFDSYHTALAAFDEDAVNRYIKGYAPHQVSTEVSAILGELAGKGGTQTREAIMGAQAQGDLGGVIMAQLLNAVGKGGRLEDTLGAARQMNHRDAGRLSALTLTDNGAVLLDRDFLRGLKSGTGRVLGGAGEVAEDMVSTQYMTVHELNEALGPVLRRLADQYDVPLPKNWDGKIFNDNPLDVASSYIENLDEVVAQWGYVDSLHSAGLAVRHGSAPDAQGMLQSIYANTLRNSRVIREKSYATPRPGDKTAPVDFLRQMVDPVDWRKAEYRASGQAADYPILQGTKIDPQTLEVGAPAVRAQDWDEFVTSVRGGIEKPIKVGFDAEGYAVIIDGHNRLRAAIDAGMTDVPIEWQPMTGLDEVARKHGVNLRRHLKKDWVTSEPNPVRTEAQAAEIVLTPEQDQLARKMRNGIARTSEQSTTNKAKMRALYNRDQDMMSQEQIDEAKALARWWYANREFSEGPLYRALNQEEASNLRRNLAAYTEGDRAIYDFEFVNTDPTGAFAKSARKGGGAAPVPKTPARLTMDPMEEGTNYMHVRNQAGKYMGRVRKVGDVWYGDDGGVVNAGGRMAVVEADNAHDAMRKLEEYINGNENVLSPDEADVTGWVVEFEPGTLAAKNDLNQGMEIGKTGEMEDEWFVSGQFEVVQYDREGKYVKFRAHNQDKMPGLRHQERQTMERAVNRDRTAPNLPPLFHGSRRGVMTERLAPLEEALKRGDAVSGNLFGPGLYSTTGVKVANTGGYGGGQGGTINRLKWTGKSEPKILDLTGDIPDDVANALRRWADELSEENPGFQLNVFDEDDMIQFGDDINGDYLVTGAATPQGWEIIESEDFLSELPDDIFDPNRIFDTKAQLEEYVRRAWDVMNEGASNPEVKGFKDLIDRAIASNTARNVNVPLEDLWGEARRMADRLSGTDLNDSIIRLNMALRDAGYDAMRYDGGVRMGGDPHDAYVWLRPEKLKMIEEPSVKEVESIADTRSALALGFDSVEELHAWRRAGGPTSEVPDNRPNITGETADYFETVPWKKKVKEERVLKGFSSAAKRAEQESPQLSVAMAAKKAGFRSAEDAEEVAKIITDPDFYENWMPEVVVARNTEHLTEVARGKVGREPRHQILTRSPRESEERFGLQQIKTRDWNADEIENGIAERVKLANGQTLIRRARGNADSGKKMLQLDALLDKDGTLQELRLNRYTPDKGEWTRADQTALAIEEVNALMREGVLDGNWVRRMLQSDSIDYLGDDEKRVVWSSMLHMINDLPDAVKETFTGMPAELVGFHRHYDAFYTELNQLFNDYGAIYSPRTGELFTGTAEVAGSEQFVERVKGLRKAAKHLNEEYGMQSVTDIFRGVDEFIGLADRPGFVNPRMFALGGPALESSVVQHDMLKFTRQLARNAGSIYTPEGVAALKLSTNKVLQWWKAMATISRPGFHVRNLIGGVWNNMIIGVGPQNYKAVSTNAVAIRRKVLEKGMKFDEAIKAVIKDPREQKIWMAAWENDVLSGFVSTEFRNLTGAEKNSRLSWANVFDIEQFGLTRVGGKFMEGIEDFLRMSAFHTWYDPDNPATAKVARDMVKAVHFDYANLTPFESKVKQFVPFFVWTKNNISLQVRQFAENPRMMQRYRAMMNGMDDQFEDSGYPHPENYSAFAFDTGYKVNGGTPFWARVMIDPDLPVRDFLELPNPTPPDLINFANEMLGPHIGGLVDLNSQREFGPVNAPAPFNSILKTLAAVGLYDTTTDGDVRIPYWARTVMETAVPFNRDLIEPAFGGPTDPARQGRAGIGEDAGALESIGKAFAAPLTRAMGVQYSGPADIRSAAAGSNQAMDALVEQLRMSGQLPPAPEQGGGASPLGALFPGG